MRRTIQFFASKQPQWVFQAVLMTIAISVLVQTKSSAAVTAFNGSYTFHEDNSFLIRLAASETTLAFVTFSVPAPGAPGYPAHGTLSPTGVLPGDTVLYTPHTNFFGGDQFTFTATSAAGGAATGTNSLNILPVNDRPIPVYQTVSTLEDTPVTVYLSALDVDNPASTLTFSIVSASVTNGSCTFTSPNIVVFRPATNYNGGAARFDFTVYDGAATETGRVTVAVQSVNDAPALGTIGDRTILEDAPQVVHLSGVGSGASNEAQTLAADPRAIRPVHGWNELG